MMVLVGYWPLNEESGDTAYDYSGNEYHGSLEGSPTQGVDGVVGCNAYEFDGGGDYVDVVGPEELFTDGKSFTVSQWIRFDETKQVWFFGNYIGGTDEGAGFVYNRDGNEEISIYDGISFYFYGIKSVPTIGDWHHIVLERTESDYTLYIDGEKIGTQTTGEEFFTNTDENIRMGDARPDNSDPGLDGLMNDVRIYNRALTASEVQYLYNVSRRGCFISRKKQS